MNMNYDDFGRVPESKIYIWKVDLTSVFTFTLQKVNFSFRKVQINIPETYI